MSVISDRIGPLTLPDLPRAACRENYRFTQLPRDVQAITCETCPEHPRCPFSALRGERPATVRVNDADIGRAVSRKRRSPGDKVCEVCRNKFLGHGRSRYCSRNCARSRQCGTRTGMAAHIKHDEQPCGPCLAAPRGHRPDRRTRGREARDADNPGSCAA